MCIRDRLLASPTSIHLFSVQNYLPKIRNTTALIKTLMAPPLPPRYFSFIQKTIYCVTTACYVPYWIQANEKWHSFCPQEAPSTNSIALLRRLLLYSQLTFTSLLSAPSHLYTWCSCHMENLTFPRYTVRLVGPFAFAHALSHPVGFSSSLPPWWTLLHSWKPLS